MIMEYKTRRNQFGHREELIIDFDKKVYNDGSRRIIPEGIEITRKEYRDIITRLKAEGFQNVNSL